MRFTSILSLITFVGMMKRAGFTCSLSDNEILDRIKGLSYYISNYDSRLIQMTNDSWILKFSRKDVSDILLIDFIKED